MQQLVVTAEQNRLNAANALQLADISAQTAAVQARVADVTSARAMQVAVKSRMPSILTVIAVVGGFACFAGVLLNWFPALTNPAVAVTVGMVLQAVIGEFKNAFGYYLGGVADAPASPTSKPASPQ